MVSLKEPFGILGGGGMDSGDLSLSMSHLSVLAGEHWVQLDHVCGAGLDENVL